VESCHHGFVSPRAADGGDGLQMWRVAAKILNEQSRIAGKGWSSSLMVRRGQTSPHIKKTAFFEMLRKVLDFTNPYEHDTEPSDRNS
jgi:hypothetical protein